MELPYLKFSVYKTCPLQFKYRFVQKPDVYIPYDRRYAYLGILLQKLVEEFYLQKWWKHPDVITRMRQALPVYSQQILEGEKFNLTDKEILEWNTIAQETLPLIVETVKKEKLLSNEVYTEREEEIPFEDDKLQGKSDLVIIRRGIVTMLDGKGGKTVGKYVDKDQLYFYAYLAAQAWLKRLPHRLGFWWFRHSRIVWLPVSHEIVDTLLVKVREVIAGIKAQKYDPKPGQYCRLCDYRPICPDGQRFIASRHKICDADIPEGNFGEVGF